MIHTSGMHEDVRSGNACRGDDFIPSGLVMKDLFYVER